MFVYIREAHPEDEWQLPSNAREGVVFAQPTTWLGRQAVARTCCERLELSMPVVVDTVANEVDDAYAAWPERIFVVDRDGRIAHAGKQGPWGFKPNEARRVLRGLLHRD